MCFSATASFAAAAATAAIGGFTLAKARRARDVPLAVVPLLFAAQQTVEGVLWLLLGRGVAGGPAVAALSLAFLLFAEALWPALIPLAVLLVEPDRARRRVMAALFAGGAAQSAYALVLFTDFQFGVAIHERSLHYAGTGESPVWMYLPYLACTAGALLLSSHRTLRAAGWVVLAGFVVSLYAHYAAFVSVWCFFAAADSTLLYLHFHRRAAAAGGARPARAG